MILVNFEHLASRSPYRSSHAIFVRENAIRAFPEAGTVPVSIESRLISVRAFDRKHEMIEAEVAEGEELATMIPRMLENQVVAYLHLHNAKPGCFAASVTRTE